MSRQGGEERRKCMSSLASSVVKGGERGWATPGEEEVTGETKRDRSDGEAVLPLLHLPPGLLVPQVCRSMVPLACAQTRWLSVQHSHQR